MELETILTSEVIRRYALVSLETGSGFLIMSIIQAAYATYGNEKKNYRLPKKGTEKFNNLYHSLIEFADALDEKNEKKKIDALRKIAMNLEVE